LGLSLKHANQAHQKTDECGAQESCHGDLQMKKGAKN
jgi:hypothetical protein